MKNKRMAGLDLLKIISMIMIVASHLSIHGNWPIFESFTLNSIFISFFGSFGNVGVNIYILITAYFMIDKGLNIERFARIIFKTIFYGVGMYLVLYIIGFVQFDVNTLLMYLPFKEKSYWFIDNYILLMLFSPFLNIIINKANKSQIKYMIVIGLVFSSIISTVYLVDTVVSYLFWFIILYMVGGYLKKHYKSDVNENKRFMIVIFLLLSTFSTVLLLRYIEMNTGIVIANGSYYFIGKNRLLVLITSIQLFVLFKNFNIKNNKAIDFTNNNLLGVYLIHDSGALRYILWHTIINIGGYYYSRGFILYATAIMAIIFVLCILCTYLITQCIENPLFKIINRPLKQLQIRYNDLWNI